MRVLLSLLLLVAMVGQVEAQGSASKRGPKGPKWKVKEQSTVKKTPDTKKAPDTEDIARTIFSEIEANHREIFWQKGGSGGGKG